MLHRKIIGRVKLSGILSIARSVAVKCTASEALVETLVRHKVKKVFGIVGSAFIDPLDLFPDAGIDFIDVTHVSPTVTRGYAAFSHFDFMQEQNAVHMADVYGRMTGIPGVAMGQNGPGITNMVTGVATAFLNHAPVCVITPQSGADSIGKLGFQELQQLPMMANITKYQVHVEHPPRMNELLGRALDRCLLNRGPTQMNYSRNILGTVSDYEFKEPMQINPVIPDASTIDSIVQRIAQAKKPVILAGGGLENATAVKILSQRLNCPVATTYLHNDCFPYTDERYVGPLGYMGSQAAMKCVMDSDLVIAVGTRLNPFGKTNQYSMAYWDDTRPLIQIDSNRDALGVSCNPTLAVCGDAARTIEAVNERMDKTGFAAVIGKPAIPFKQYMKDWHEFRAAKHLKITPEGRIPPRMVLRTFADVLKELDGPIVTTDIGHCCSQSLAYLEFDRPKSLFTAGTFGSCGTSIPMAVGARFADADRPVFALVGDGAVNMQGINELLTCFRRKLGITVVCFRNEVWGAELLNQLIWTDGRAVGSEIENPSIAGIARGFGAHGVTVSGSTEALADELRAAAARQKEGLSTLIEVMCTAEMGAPFRSDAMKCPTRYLPKYKHLTTETPDFTRQYSKKE